MRPAPHFCPEDAIEFSKKELVSMRKGIHSPRLWGALGLACFALMLIRPEIARESVKSSLILCGKTVIPGLYPFIFLSGCLASLPGLFSGGKGGQWLLERVFGLPGSAATALILGALGGYPMGARTALELNRQGTLSQSDTRRLLAFCSNAGPGFVFGIVAQQLGWTEAAVIFGLHLLSAAMVGILFSGRTEASRSLPAQAAPAKTFSQLLGQSIDTMLRICGCIILFGVICGYTASAAAQWGLSAAISAFLGGILEMTTGIVQLEAFPAGIFRLCAAGFFLSFGGLCIYLQTLALTQDRSLLEWYLPGKLLQGLLTVGWILLWQRGQLGLATAAAVACLGLMTLFRNRAGNPKKSIV